MVKSIDRDLSTSVFDKPGSLYTESESCLGRPDRDARFVTTIIIVDRDYNDEMNRYDQYLLALRYQKYRPGPTRRSSVFNKSRVCGFRNNTIYRCIRTVPRTATTGSQRAIYIVFLKKDSQLLICVGSGIRVFVMGLIGIFGLDLLQGLLKGL